MPTARSKSATARLGSSGCAGSGAAPGWALPAALEGAPLLVALGVCCWGTTLLSSDDGSDGVLLHAASAHASTPTAASARTRAVASLPGTRLFEYGNDILTQLCLPIASGLQLRERLITLAH